MTPRSHSVISAIKNEHETEKAKCRKRERKIEKQLEVHSASWCQVPFERVATTLPLFGLKSGLQKPFQCHQIDAEKDALFIVIHCSKTIICVLLIECEAVEWALKIGKRMLTFRL